jgi:hypothetical protein
MRLLSLPLLFVLLSGCGNEIDHPDMVAGCDPATMKCYSQNPDTGSVGGGEAGASSSGDEVADSSGQVAAFRDDYFEIGTVFTGTAEVSAAGENGARVKGSYDGNGFTLKNVLKTGSNWFLVDPSENQGVVPTLTVVDTRTTKADALLVGVARQGDIEGIFQLSLSGEPSDQRAQIVLTVVDEQGRSVAGVSAQLITEVIAYRTEETWDASEGGSTDQSGMIFLGNVPAASALGTTDVVLSGTANATVEVQVQAGTTSVVTVVVGQ